MTQDRQDAVPDALLLPLLEAAADVLRASEADAVPPALRHLRGFDRRGLMHGPAPRQLRQALARDDEFRARVIERFGAQQGVISILSLWGSGDPWSHVEEAAARQDLPLLASALWACAPANADFGLGLVVAFDAFERRDKADQAAARARGRELAELEEARRRADAARLDALADAERVAEELRDERRTRRAREERAVSDAQAAHRRAEGLGAKLEQAQAANATERDRAAREIQRARALEEELRGSRADLTDLVAKNQHTRSRLDLQDSRALADASAATQRLSAQLETLRSRIETAAGRGSPSTTPIPEKPLARRVSPRVPAGVVATTPIGVEAMLRTEGVLLVIDGYNVTKRAWPDASPGEQRERLGVAVTQLHRRLGCEVLCVFDGDGSGPRPTIRRGGVRAMFSDADEEADEVVVREIAARPKRVPVVVVSSDAWVREHAEAEGAVVVPADALLGLLRPSR